MPENGNFVTNISEKITPEGAKKSRKVEVGDIILSNSMSFGKPYIMGVDGYIHDGWFVIREFEKYFDKEYLCQLLVSPFVQNQYKKLAAGGVVLNISSDLVNSVKAPIISIAEQKKIAEFLSLVDKRIDKQRQLVENLKKYKRGLLINIFEDTTSNWTSQKLGDICSYRRGSFPQPYGLPMWYDDKNGMPFIQVADVNDDMTVNIKTKRRISEVAKSKSVFIPKGTLIVTLQGTIGRVAITTFNAYIDRTLLVVQNISQNVLKEFLMLAIYMKFNIEKQTADGSIIKTITKETLTDFYIKLPTIEFQEKIVALMNHYNKILYLETQKLNNLIKIKQGLLQQMFI